MKRRDVIWFIVVWTGLVKGARVPLRVRSFCRRPIEDLDLPFGAVATALRTGAGDLVARGLDARRRGKHVDRDAGDVLAALRDRVVLIGGGPS